MPGDADFCYLTTTGRVTGDRHTVELWFAIAGPTLFLMHEGSVARPLSDWIRNLARDPAVTVRLAARDATEFSAQARLVDPASAEDRLGRDLLVQKYRSRWSGDLTSWGRNGVVVAIDLPADWVPASS